MIVVTNLGKNDLLAKGLTQGDVSVVQAFGIWLRRVGPAPAPGEKRVIQSRIDYAYALGQVTPREYLVAVALEHRG